ncbi:DNA polymerase III subunit chi [Temperatibacter marinus]|uniref:DNA polymerase III subunit chi n=1 Tax=Temperatibacter marinus TaxID=1456591 RepID=A0AA52EHC9_9PROT|nr:DNA polymerase III subunit chi [Temperatibacter marinus]WND02339.1 DNA polymerase III subunit chi [Temperatibacter marinus]
MPDIRFYHLENEGLEGALPKLMERVISAGLRAVVKVKDTDQSALIDELLWSYKPDAFLPHDTEDSPQVSLQPILITTQQHRLNEAECLILLDADNWDDFDPFKRILYMFDGKNEEVVTAARLDWKAFKEKGFEMSYWQQMPGGGWDQKA